MKRLFLADLILILLLLSCSTLSNEKQILSSVPGTSAKDNADFLGQYYSENSGIELSYNYAYYLVQDGRLDEAYDVALRAVLAYPGYIRFHYLKAYIEKTQMRLFSYEKTLLGILSFNPGDMTARKSLIELYSRLRYIEKAISLSYDTLQLDPSDRTALLCLAEHFACFSQIVQKNEEENSIKEKLQKQPSLIPYSRTFTEAIKSFRNLSIS